ncbi:MAG: hypothetical protein GEU94_10620 [Micromonosporaceae bacterium]|nr:hypothetical protein [Micromonosporaceae bacterium]
MIAAGASVASRHTAGPSTGRSAAAVAAPANTHARTATAQVTGRSEPKQPHGAVGRHNRSAEVYAPNPA